MRREAARHAVWQGLTFRDLLNAAMVDRPDTDLITDIGLDGTVMHFAPRTLDHIAARIARRFATAGAKPGDAIIIAMPNGAAAWLALLGALGAGLKPCLVPPTLDEPAIALLLQRLKPRAIVSSAWNDFDPLARFVLQARRLAMPLYIWNFGTNDNDHAAPLADLLNGEAPQRMLPLHPPHPGDGPILTIADFGDGPEPVTHRQDAMLAQAVLARMAQRTTPATRMISAVSLATQAGLVLGPVRALLAGAQLTLIADPSIAAMRAAAVQGPAEWLLPQSIAARLRECGLHDANGTVTTLYRAGVQLHNPSDETGFIAFGEALTLPLIRHGQALAPGAIGASTADGLLHFASLETRPDGTLALASQLAGRRTNGAMAAPSLLATLGPDGRFARFVNTPWEKHRA